VNHLTTAQEEQLKNIGTYLRHCREEQEKSIEEIALKTFISLRSLKALELDGVRSYLNLSLFKGLFGGMPKH